MLAISILYTTQLAQKNAPSHIMFVTVLLLVRYCELILVLSIFHKTQVLRRSFSLHIIIQQRRISVRKQHTSTDSTGVGRAETAIPVPMWYQPHAKENYWNNSPRLFLLLIHACLFCSPATVVTTPQAERLIFGNDGQRNYTSFGDLMDNREFVGWEEESAMHLPCTRYRSRRGKPYAHAVW